MIVEERLTTYLHSLESADIPVLDEIEQEALADMVPIIRKETKSFLKVMLEIKRPVKILEIGTAVGFSAILMGKYSPEECHITTIENYEKRIPIARANFARAGMEQKITLLEGDALEIMKGMPDDAGFDFVFMDAAKGQYPAYLEQVMRFLVPGGILITDNVLQDGDIIESRFAVERRDRTIHSRMREYLYTLKHHPELETSILPLGDGVALSVRKKKQEITVTERKKIMARHPELLIPASSLEVLKTAVVFGADAVYIGGEAFGLRAKAKNFSKEDMMEGIRFAHEHDVKVYVTANILAHNYDLEGVREYFKELKEIKPDALIIADPGVFEIAKEVCPEIERHVSTQANNTNYATYMFWYRQGASRVVSARELSMREIKEIRAHIPDDLEIETFVHGAMCISYSGRCLLSNFFTGRDANHGACTHPCRWKYSVVEETRPGEYMPVYENERGTYIFNSKDLCMIEHIPELIDAGIDSFKIEGRMKTALYVATVARTYRKAIDDYQKDPELYRKNMPWYLDQISNCTYRQFTTGFFFGKPSEEAQIYDSNTYIREYTYLGITEEIKDGMVKIEQRNKFSVGETIEIMKPNGDNVEVQVKRIVNEEGEEQESAPHPKQVLYVELSGRADKYDILRRKEEADE